MRQRQPRAEPNVQGRLAHGRRDAWNVSHPPFLFLRRLKLQLRLGGTGVLIVHDVKRLPVLTCVKCMVVVVY